MRKLRFIGGLVALLAALGVGAVAHAAAPWVEGKNYFLVEPPRPPSLPPGKVAVTEVFSYGCPACNLFAPTMRKLKAEMPANVVVDYLPAAFQKAEDWPMLQQAYFTAQVLGVADRTHEAMFDAVWKTGELTIIDPVTNRIKDPVPSLEDAARFYNRHAGVPIATFLSTAKSFAVDVKIRSAEDLIMAYKIDRTPTIVIDGKYRLHVESAGGADQLIELVKYLVAKESK